MNRLKKEMGDLPGGPVEKNLLASAGDMGSILVQEDFTCCGATKTARCNQ